MGMYEDRLEELRRRKGRLDPPSTSDIVGPRLLEIMALMLAELAAEWRALRELDK